jgi:diguanylate cyclase (GGDEF)-like protein/PAS domain S-box-containing protein
MPPENLAAEYEALLQFLYLCPVGVVEIDPSGEVSRMNPHAAQLLLPLAGAGGLGNLLEALAPHAPALGPMIQQFSGEAGTICHNLPVELRRAGGAPGRRPWMLALTVLKVCPAQLMVVLSDISELMAKQQAIRASERRLRAIFDGVRDCAIYSLDAAGRIDSWNRSGERLLGYQAEETIGRPADFLYEPGAARNETVAERIEGARQSVWDGYEGWYQCRDGSTFWGEENLSVLADDDGQVAGFSVVVRDITGRHQTEERLRAQARTDELTGLCNRRHFLELLAGEFERFRRHRTVFSLLMIDADLFKQVNDTHGHHAGDLVLQEIARLCRANLRALDTVGRIGGEEFAVLLPSTGPQGAYAVAERIRQAAAAMVVRHEQAEIRLTLSLGVAVVRADTRDPEELLHDADQALYAAKAGGRNRTILRLQAG